MDCAYDRARGRRGPHALGRSLRQRAAGGPEFPQSRPERREWEHGTQAPAGKGKKEAARAQGGGALVGMAESGLTGATGRAGALIRGLDRVAARANDCVASESMGELVRQRAGPHSSEASSPHRTRSHRADLSGLSRRE